MTERARTHTCTDTHTHTRCRVGEGGWGLLPPPTAAVATGTLQKAESSSENRPAGSSLGEKLSPQQPCSGCGRDLGSVAPPRICSNTATWSLKPENLQPVSRVSSVRPDP